MAVHITENNWVGHTHAVYNTTKHMSSCSIQIKIKYHCNILGDSTSKCYHCNNVNSNVTTGKIMVRLLIDGTYFLTDRCCIQIPMSVGELFNQQHSLQVTSTTIWLHTCTDVLLVTILVDTQQTIQVCNVCLLQLWPLIYKRQAGGNMDMGCTSTTDSVPEVQRGL